MKSFVIDPTTQMLFETEWDGTLEHIYKLTSCETVEVVTVNTDGDGIFVDEEGLLHDPQPTKFFGVTGHPHPIAGKGLVLGMDEEGNSISPKRVDLEWLKRNVYWIERMQNNWWAYRRNTFTRLKIVNLEALRDILGG